MATTVGLIASSGGADALTTRNDASAGGDGSSSGGGARRLSKGAKGGEAPQQMLGAAGPQILPQQYTYGGHTGHHIEAKAGKGSKGDAAPSMAQAFTYQHWQSPAVEPTHPWYTTASATQPWYTTAAAGGGWMSADQHAWFPPVTTQAATHPPQKGSSEDSAGWWSAHHPGPKMNTAQHMPE